MNPPLEKDRDLEEELKKWNPQSAHSPKRFVDEVMRRVYDLPTPRPWWRTIFDVRRLTVQLSPVVALVLVLGIGIGIGYWVSRPARAPSIIISTEELRKPQVQKEFVVKFVYMDPNARSVHVIGDFNNWQKVPMHRQAGGLWTLTMPVSEGQYNYQFLVDGKKFVVDPSAPEESEDGFGQKDSVLSL